MKLRPSKVAICVTHAIDENKWVGKLVGDFFCDCMEKIVDWHHILVCSTEPLELRAKIME